MPAKLTLFIVIVLSALAGAGFVYVAQKTDAPAPKNQPLYWVAPMDDSYRQDKPGKSPMGMDLVPVYKSDISTEDTAGVVKISAHVINNLGVRTSPVLRQAMQSKISTVGYVQYDQDKLIHIHPRVDGWIEKLYVKAAGDPVSKNQPLYTLYSPQLVNAQEELLIALRRSNQSLITAARERLQALQLSAEFIKSLEKTHKIQQTVTFNSPKDGVVDGLKIREGFYVQPGNTLLSIGQLDQVWVEAEVFERDTSLIAIDLPVTMTLDYLPGRSWQGTVDYVYPTLNNKTRTLRVRLKFNNPDLLLKPNMFAQVTIHAKTRQDTLLVPKESVIRTGKQDRVVLALGEGQFKSVAVTIGQVEQDYIEVIAGVTEDDVVVTSSHFLIDSESSKSADLDRMTQRLSQSDSAVSRATVNGTINSIDLHTRTVNISRDAIQKWNRPADTMDFIAADNLVLEHFSQGDAIRFTFEVGEAFVITDMTQQSNVEHSGHHNSERL